MSKQILAILKKKLESVAAHGGADAETLRNALKEELQYYVLNFVYHHLEYNKWIMYGGSALRIIHGLDRMSVDLDFETPDQIDSKFLERLKKEIEGHFARTYRVSSDFMSVKIVTERGVLLKFNVGEALGLGHPSGFVHLKIDLNQFAPPKAVTERRPINHDQLSFVILTYNMSTLMASKVAAIFLRGTRGVGKAVYEEKGRDIYDLLWYMNSSIVPDLNYLLAKDVEEAGDLRTLFDKLTIRMNKVSDTNLKQDLFPLFLDRMYIENWLGNWRESYSSLLNKYKICMVANLESVVLSWDHTNLNFLFRYIYRAEDGRTLDIYYQMTWHWVEDLGKEFPPVEVDGIVQPLIHFANDGKRVRPGYTDKLIRYATLFYQKTEKYLKKTNRVVLGRNVETKLIRMTADQLNRKEQIVLNKSALLSCDLEDLLK